MLHTTTESQSECRNILPAVLISMQAHRTSVPTSVIHFLSFFFFFLCGCVCVSGVCVSKWVCMCLCLCLSVCGLVCLSVCVCIGRTGRWLCVSISEGLCVCERGGVCAHVRVCLRECLHLQVLVCVYDCVFASVCRRQSAFSTFLFLPFAWACSLSSSGNLPTLWW